MKIRMEVDPGIEEEELVIRLRELNEETANLQLKLAEAVRGRMQMEVSKGETTYYLDLPEILFLETADNFVAVHTKNQIYETRQKLYELQELLPGNFVRVSKSTIINVNGIRSIKKNITGASEVEFAGCSKRTFVSRNYYKFLMSKMEEKRLKR